MEKEGKVPRSTKGLFTGYYKLASYIMMRLILVQGVLPYISHIDMCHHKGMVLTPFWPEDGYRLCQETMAILVWNGVGVSRKLQV